MPPRRLADIAAEKIVQAFEDLALPQAVKDRLEWDVVPCMSPAGIFFVPVVSVQIPGGIDYAQTIARPPGIDAHEPQSVWGDAIRQLAEAGLRDADEHAGIVHQNGNGKMSAGGLALP